MVSGDLLFPVSVDDRIEFDHVRGALVEVGGHFAGLEGE